MRQKALAVLLALAYLFAVRAMVGGQEPIKLDGNVEVVKVPQTIVVQVDRTVVKDFSRKVTLTAPAGGLLYRWRWPVGVKAVELSNVLEITDAPKGEASFSVQWAVIDFEKKLVAEKAAQIVFFFGEVKPPEPEPKPKPPTPEPDPIPVGALRVIFVRESADNMSREQLNIWNSTQIAAYLNAKAVKDGAQPGWRKWDDDQGAAADPAMKPLWDDAKAKAATMLPAVIIAVGTQATVYPLPATEADTMALLKKHAEG